jgi:hypothetical protein
VALVDDDEAVAVEGPPRFFLAGEALDGGDVDDMGGSGARPSRESHLVRCQAEMFAEPCPPLFDQLTPVAQHERRDRMMGDEGAGHHRLARPRWGNNSAASAANPRGRWIRSRSSS